MALFCAVIGVCILVLFGATVISWFPLQPGTTLAGLARVLQIVTDPVLGPLRRFVPTVQLGGFALDLSPLIVILGLMVVEWAICP